MTIPAENLAQVRFIEISISCSPLALAYLKHFVS